MANTTSPGSYRGVTITPGSNEAVAEQVRNIDLQNKSSAPKINSTGNNITPPTSSTPINSKNITPTNPIIPSTVPTPTQTPGLLGTIESQAQQYADSLVSNKAVEDARSAKESTLKVLTDRLTNYKGQSTLTDTAYSDTVDPVKKELNAINDQIRTEQLSLRRKLEAIDKNPRGATAEGLAQEQRAVQKESLAVQADLAVIQQAKQDNYYGAKEIADRKVTAQLEQQRQDLDILQFTYNENKDLFNKQEQRQFEAQQSERTRLLNKQETELKAVNDLAIEALRNGAPTNVVRQMQTSTNQADAIAIGGGYVGLVDRQNSALDRQIKNAQLAKINQEISDAGGTGVDKETLGKIVSTPEYKSIVTVIPAITAIKKYSDAIRENGSFELLDAKGKGDLQQSYGNAIAAWKTLAGLGALSGADFGLAENAIPKPSLFARDAKVQAQLDGSIDNAISQAKTMGSRIGTLYPNAQGLMNQQISDLELTAYPAKLSNDQLLNSIPGSFNGSTSATNASFFNQF